MKNGVCFAICIMNRSTNQFLQWFLQSRESTDSMKKLNDKSDTNSRKFRMIHKVRTVSFGCHAPWWLTKRIGYNKKYIEVASRQSGNMKESPLREYVGKFHKVGLCLPSKPVFVVVDCIITRGPIYIKAWLEMTGCQKRHPPAEQRKQCVHVVYSRQANHPGSIPGVSESFFLLGDLSFI